MSIEQIPVEGWAWFVVALLALTHAYNLFSTARKNAREEKKRQSQPTATVAERVTAQAKMLDNDKRRLDEHDRQISDIRRGQMVNCAGVQALLEHELHNGNTTEMQDASKAIDKWLRERP